MNRVFGKNCQFFDWTNSDLKNNGFAKKGNLMNCDQAEF